MEGIVFFAKAQFDYAVEGQRVQNCGEVHENQEEEKRPDLMLSCGRLDLVDGRRCRRHRRGICDQETGYEQWFGAAIITHSSQRLDHLAKQR